jgi:hypothetical protein
MSFVSSSRWTRLWSSGTRVAWLVAQGAEHPTVRRVGTASVRPQFDVWGMDSGEKVRRTHSSLVVTAWRPAPNRVY